MSNAVTSGSALVGPTAPCGVASGSMFSGGGAGGGAVCWTSDGGVDAEEMEGFAGEAGAAGVAVCALAAGSRAIKVRQINAKREAAGVAPAVVRVQGVLEWVTGPSLR